MRSSLVRKHAHVAVVEDRVVRPVGLVDLVQGLRDQEGAQPVAGHEGERALEEVEAAERRKLIEHQQQALAIVRCRLEPSSDSVRRRPIWLSSSRMSGLVRLMSEGGTTR